MVVFAVAVVAAIAQSFISFYLLYSQHITLFVAECVNSRFSSAPYKINNFISLADLFYFSFVRSFMCPLCHRFHLNLNIFCFLVIRTIALSDASWCAMDVLLMLLLLHLVRNTVSMVILLLKHEHETFCLYINVCVSVCSTKTNQFNRKRITTKRSSI